MSRRRFLSCAAILPGILILPGLTGCRPERPLQVAIHPWIGYETMRLARDMGWLPTTVSLLETADLSASAQALRQGDVDAACLTLDEMLLIQSTGVSLAAVMVFDVSAGADAVLVRPNIKRLQQLAGKRIGVEPSALSDLIMQKLLEAARLPASAITVKTVRTSEQLQAWRNNEVDAVITYEPTSSLLLREGAERLFDSRQMPELIFDVLAVRNDRLSEVGNGLRDAVSAHFQALSHLLKNRDDAHYRLAHYEQISVGEVRRALAGISTPTLVANRSYLSERDGRLRMATETLSRILVDRGEISSVVAPGKLFSPDYLPGE